jgi:hypothetical protein
VDDSIEETVYTKPLPDIVANHNVEYFDAIKEKINFVEKKYFTKDKIEELKEIFIRKIRESENPFNIYCVDKDGGYNVTEDQLFDIGL